MLGRTLPGAAASSRREANIGYLTIIEVVGGLALLLVFADFLVRGAVGLARLVNMSPLIVGLTVVAFGTSAPEFVTALTATLNDAPGMAVGNVVGSNIANVLLILGVAAAIHPLACTRQIIWRDGIAGLLASFVFVGFAAFGELERISGLLLLACLGTYLALTYRHERQARASASLHTLEAEEIAGTPERGWLAALMVVGGIVGISVGADLLVGGSVDIARALGVSDSLIGLTLIAIGTSLPELATAVMASLRRHADVALGNVLGSNIFNLLAIGGGVSALTPVDVPNDILHFDVWFMLATGALLLPVMVSDREISRREGALLVSLYVVYLGIQIARAAVWTA